MAKELARINDDVIELISLNPDYEDRKLDRLEVLWIARIVWVTQ